MTLMRADFVGWVDLMTINDFKDPERLFGGGDLRSMTLKGGDYVELTTEQQTPNLLS